MVMLMEASAGAGEPSAGRDEGPLQINAEQRPQCLFFMLPCNLRCLTPSASLLTPGHTIALKKMK